MASWLIEETVDISRAPNAQNYAAVRHLLIPGDNLAHTWKLTVNRSGSAYSLSGYTAYAEFLRPDGATVVLEGAISANTITIAFTSACYEYPGAMRALVRVANAAGRVTTLTQRLFRVQSGTTDSIVDPGHIFDTAAALEDRVAAAEALLKSIQTAGTGVDYSQELAATIYELQKISDWFGTHPWEYYPLDSTYASVDATGAITDTTEAATPILTNYIEVPPSGKIEVSWSEKVGNNQITASIWSADRSTFLGQLTRQCRYDDVFSYVFPNDFAGSVALEPGMWVRFQWPNKEDKNFTNMAFRDAYQPDYETVDAAIKALEAADAALGARITGVEENQLNMDIVVEGAARAMDVPAAIRAANAFRGINESVTRRTLTVSPYGWSSVWLSGTVPASTSTYSGLIPFAYTFNAGQPYTIYATGQNEITGLLIRPYEYGVSYVKQNGATVSGVVNGGAVSFVPDETITVDYINAWHDGSLVPQETAVAGELFIMIVPGAYTTDDFSLSAMTDETGTVVPGYWKDALNAAIANAQAQDLALANHGDSFIWLTDYHYPSNANRSPALIKRILAETSIDKVFYGGDTLNSYQSRADALAVFGKFWRLFGGVRMFVTPGNHDNNSNGNPEDQTVVFTAHEVYTQFGRHMEAMGIQTNIGENVDCDAYGITENRRVPANQYYVDNAVQKIRYIFVATFCSNSYDGQKLWLKAVLESTPAGYTVVMLGHSYWNARDWTFRDIEPQLMDVVDAWLATDPDAEFACYLCGHIHTDHSLKIEVPTQSGTTRSYYIIARTTDAYARNHAATMTLGTTTEQAFDVVHIDTAAKNVHIERVGAESQDVIEAGEGTEIVTDWGWV